MKTFNITNCFIFYIGKMFFMIFGVFPLLPKFFFKVVYLLRKARYKLLYKYRCEVIFLQRLQLFVKNLKPCVVVNRCCQV